MIEQSTLDFLSDLSNNNNRDWFNENRTRYESAKQNFAEFLEGLIVEIQKFDPFLQDANAKNTVFRIFRDVRFGKNKDPYKSHFGAAISRGGRKSEYPGYYIHLNPNGDTFVGGGIYHPQPAVLKSIRQEIEYNTKQFENIISDNEFLKAFKELEGDKLVRPPKGYDKEHPAVEHLKRKDFLMLYHFDANKAVQKNFNKFCIDQFKKMLPLNLYLRGPVQDVINPEA